MKSLLMAYLKGFVPYGLVLAVTNFEVTEASLVFSMSWANAYFLISYLVFFPLLVNLRQKAVPKPQSRPVKSIPRDGKKTNWELEALKIGYTKGIDRDYTKPDNWLERWAMAFCRWLLWILLGPVIYVGQWVKAWYLGR
ncbi:MAG TPA: hypothetical protein H9875_00970 [Candidatus Levilactobacillus faecigallinarum]|uniref:Uncharacterized protein n=1 Tax=Candidatus Levilactobacillus faecigallinarum TaxID=2838638 RepID=A0A9D1U3T3_9LACO|nr:hypothetical protein [Candidatus Levilactobacillus faecigallinarum]